MAAFFSQVGYKSTVEWKEEIVFFDSARAPARRRLRFPRRKAGPRVAGPGPARGLRRLADRTGEPLVRPQHREPRLVLAAGPRHHPRAGRHPARQPASQSRTAGLPGARAGRGALRPEADLPADPEFAGVPALLDFQDRSPGGRSPISLSTRSAGWTRKC